MISVYGEPRRSDTESELLYGEQVGRWKLDWWHMVVVKRPGKN